MDPEIVKAYELMKRYAVMDIEGIKEMEAVQWNVTEEYEDDWNVEYKTKDRGFQYQTMLENLMNHLEAVGGVEFAVLKDPELGRWWAKKVKQRNEERKLKEARDKLYATMTAEELKILGIKKQ